MAISDQVDVPSCPAPAPNRAFAATFGTDRLTIGLTVPIEAYPVGGRPSIDLVAERVRLAEELGFSAIWLRDVPFDVPSFGDPGQLLDPFVTLGLLAGATERIALGVASVILPLRHPAHVAKAAASADQLSGGRLLLGVASGDRPDEYPAMAVPFERRDERFRDAVAYVRAAAEERPTFANTFGAISGGMDLVPKPHGDRLPLLITGSSRQAPDWIARHGDGWMTYPRDPATQGRVVSAFRELSRAESGIDKPVMQPLYVDLVDRSPGGRPQPIHLGLRLDPEDLVRHLRAVRSAGIAHVALNLRFTSGDVVDTMRRIADDVLPRLDPDEGDPT